VFGVNSFLVEEGAGFIVSFFLSFVNCGGFLVEAGQACDVAGDDAGPDEAHGDPLGGAVQLVSPVVVAMGQAAL
jgi:hypothetical protein